MQLSVELSVDSEEAESAAELLRSEGGEEVEELEEAGILPGALVVVVGLIAVSGLANVIIRLSRAFACGTIVDARGDPVRTTKDPNLPKGTVVVIAADGSQATVHEPSEVDLKDLIGAATSSG